VKRAGGAAFAATLGALTAISATSIDVVLPAQPVIALGFGLDVDAGGALVTAYLAGYGGGQLLWGPLSDRFGRLRPLFVALAMFTASGIVCATTDSFAVLLAARALQGVFGGACPAISRAVARDLGGGTATATLLATMTIILGGAPLLAPALGSLLVALFPWPAIFWFLGLFGLAAAAATLAFVPETHAVPSRRPMSLSQMAADAVTLFSNRDFVVAGALSCTIFGGYAALLSSGAAVTAVRYGVSAEAFGPLFGVAALAYVGGASVARRTVPRRGPRRVLAFSGIVAGAAGAFLVALSFAEPELPVLWSGVALFVAAFGMLGPSAMAVALEPAGRMAGFASSLLGTGTILSGAVGAVIAAALFDGTHRTLCWTMGGAGLICFTLWALGQARRRTA
jgi:DHA1 family bicyclomycin/chloramphenicol resistance-like MFS transporter